MNKGKDFKCNEQILNELQYCFKFYNLEPMVFLAYDRTAYYSEEDKNFRITFDTNIIAREYDLLLEKGIYGEKVYDDSTYVMEVKCLGGLPLWIVISSSELVKDANYELYINGEKILDVTAGIISSFNGNRGFKGGR